MKKRESRQICPTGRLIMPNNPVDVKIHLLESINIITYSKAQKYVSKTA